MLRYEKGQEEELSADTKDFSIFLPPEAQKNYKQRAHQIRLQIKKLVRKRNTCSCWAPTKSKIGEKGWIECYQSVKRSKIWKNSQAEIAAKVVFHKSKWIMKKKNESEKVFQVAQVPLGAEVLQTRLLSWAP